MTYEDFLKLETITADSIYGFSMPGISEDFQDVSGRTLADGGYSADPTSPQGLVGVHLIPQEAYTRTGAHFFVQMDLRSFCRVNGVTASFVKTPEGAFPDRVEFYGSEDGYSFHLLGEGEKLSEVDGAQLYGVLKQEARTMKLIKTVVFAKEDATVCLDEIDVRGHYGSRPLIVSSDASYALEDIRFEENIGNLILDGRDTGLDFSKSLEENDLSRFMQIDPTIVNSQMRWAQILDLQKVCNVNEILVRMGNFEAIDKGLPYGLEIYISEDGQTYEQYGMAYEYQTFGSVGIPLSHLRLAKPYTTKARYVRINFIGSETNMLDAVTVYGSEEEIAAPVLQPSDEIIPYTNVAINKPAAVNGKVVQEMTNGRYGQFDKVAMEWAKFDIAKEEALTIDIDLQESFKEICGISMEIRNQANYTPAIEVQTSVDGNKYTSQGTVQDCHLVTGKQIYRGVFDKTEARYVRLVVKDILEKIYISEIQVYNQTVHAPFIRGGWLALPIDDFKNGFYLFNKYTQNDWENLFYSMRAGGMDYAIIGQIANAETRTTLYPNPTVSDYEYFGTGDKAYAAPDQLSAMLTAADKAGMKLFMGSHIDISMLFTKYFDLNQEDRDDFMEEYIEDGNALYEEVITRYGHHKSFYGYYLSDETCDEWMRFENGQGALEARKRYFGQAELLRKLSPDKKIIIAPAIWRTLDYQAEPEEFVENLTAMLKDGPGGKPVVDIVAFQDCLGRQEVSTKMYGKLEESLSQAAAAVRAMGMEAWNDTEIFNPKFTGSKRFDEIIDSLTVEMKESNTSLVFDIIHYTNAYIGNLTEVRLFETDYIMREYSKHYDTYYDRIQMKK